MKKAAIIMNLGTPAAPTPKAVRAFLKEFLWDPRVVEVPRPLWWLILHGIILPFRARRVSRAYAGLWGEGGSPLRRITEQQTQKLAAALADSNIDVAHAMTYSGPSLHKVVEQLEQRGAEHIAILPLYPQYSATTTGSIYDQLSTLVGKRRNPPQLQLIKQYCDNPLYIEALADSVRDHWQLHGRGDRLLMSFHGIPVRNVELGDPYRRQCLRTAELLAQKLGLAEGEWAVSFQSRLGRAQWLQPYTCEVVAEWGAEGLNNIDVICPAFAADCLETLEEITLENGEIFHNSGGGELRLIPCLNDRDDHIAMMASLFEQYFPSD